MTSTNFGVQWTNGGNIVSTPYASLWDFNSITGPLTNQPLTFNNYSVDANYNIETDGSLIKFNVVAPHYINATFSGVSSTALTSFNIVLVTAGGTFLGNATASVNTSIVTPFTMNISGIYLPSAVGDVLQFKCNLSYAIITFTSVCCTAYKI